MAKISFTAPRVEAFSCPADKAQVFLWDADAPGLGLRATPGSKAYVFQSRFHGQTVRITIGSPDVWPLNNRRDRAGKGGSIVQSGAREEATRLQALIDSGRDPRLVRAERTAVDVANRANQLMRAATVQDAWGVYLAERKPRWSDHHYADHVGLAQAGGKPRTRSTAKETVAGPLAELMPLRLGEVTAERLDAWVAKEGPKRPARVRLALRLLKAFLRWCAAEPAYREAVDATAASGKKIREKAGAPKVKHDVLQREQLKAWFAAVRQIPNPVIAAYLQALLLTGARREELAALRWADVNFQWHGLSLKDKIEDNRMVPLTPYVASLLSALPRRNEWVFSSPTSKTGRLTEPSIAHRQACQIAALDGLTLHGLRRSFASLSEWIEVPAGISAQIQGHAPQGVREQNYIRRPLDLLRSWHNKIEAWILKEAAVEFVASGQALRVVK
ncbi:MAG: integrase family protein [Pseudomonadota bacterium]